MPTADARLRRAAPDRLILTALTLLTGSLLPGSALGAPGILSPDTAASTPARAQARGHASVQVVDPVRLQLEGDRVVLDRSRHHSTSRERDGSTVIHLQ